MGVAKNVLWDITGKSINQIIGLGITVVLARILLPEDYGVVGIVFAFIGLSSVFLEMGFGASIIQKPRLNYFQLSTIFWINMAIASLLAILFFSFSGLIADFYQIPILKILIRVFCLSFFFDALVIVNRSLLIRDIKFKQLSLIDLISSVTSGLLGLAAALSGWGVWALVVQSLARGLFTCGLIFFFNTWKPQMVFSYRSIRDLLSYSKDIFFSNLLINVFTKIDVFVIGKIFNKSTLGYYSRATSLNSMIFMYSSQSISNVLFPQLSKLSENKKMFWEVFLKYFFIVSFLSFFLTGFFYVIADNFFLILFTAKWNQSMFYFKILAITTFTYPLSELAIMAMKSLGDSRAVLKSEIPKKTILFLTYVFGFMNGMEFFLYAMVLSRTITLAINLWYLKKSIGESFKSIYFDILALIALTFVICFVLTWFKELISLGNQYLDLMVQGGLFISLFFFLAFLFKMEAAWNIKKMIQSKINR